MNSNSTFEKQLQEILRELGPLPEPTCERILNLSRQSQENQSNLKNNRNQVQDVMDYLRVSVKYVLLDLEATRRENAYLKSLLQKME